MLNLLKTIQDIQLWVEFYGEAPPWSDYVVKSILSAAIDPAYRDGVVLREERIVELGGHPDEVKQWLHGQGLSTYSLSHDPKLFMATWVLGSTS